MTEEEFGSHLVQAVTEYFTERYGSVKVTAWAQMWVVEDRPGATPHTAHIGGFDVHLGPDVFRIVFDTKQAFQDFTQLVAGPGQYTKARGPAPKA